jgi:hypothetical protein
LTTSTASSTYAPKASPTFTGTTTFPGTTAIISSGYLGIGTTNPQYPIHLTSARYGSTPSTWSYLNSGGGIGQGNGSNQYVSIYSNDAIAASLVINYSDKRIKKNIIDIDHNDALRELRKLSPKIYQYIDTLNNRQEPVYGFIAQDVESVLPSAVIKMTDKIPNIYDMADVSNKNIIILRTKSTSLFEPDPSGNPLKIKMHDDNDKEILTTIVSILDDKTFQIADDLEINEIFVYGQEVSDFRALDKPAIFTITTAAVQVIDTIVQEQQSQIQELHAKLDTVLVRLSNAGIA